MKKLLLVIAVALALTTVASERRISRGVGPVDTWTPSNRIADVTFWYRADSYTFSDTAGTVASTNGGIIRNWKNMTGDANYNQLDTVGTRSPLLYTNVQNGLPGVFFNGAKWLQSSANISTPQVGTIYMVFWVTNLASVLVPWSHDDTADNDAQYFAFQGTTDDFLNYSDTAASAVTSTTITSSTTIGTGQRASASLRYVWKNGGSAGTNTTTVNFTGSFEEVYVGTYKGGQAGTCCNWMGWIFEIVCVTTVDDDATRLQMHNYLDRIWAVPGYP